VTFRHPDYLLISQAAAAAFAAARLLHFRLARRFPLLCVYLFVVALFSLFFSVIAEGSRAYFVGFLAADPLTMCAAGLAVFEMFALIFRNYPGLRTAGRWTLYTALSASVVISLGLGWKLPRGGSRASVWLYYELVFDRSVHASLALIVVILMFVLSRYPLPLDRNTLVASWFFSVMFLAEAAAKLVDSISPHLFARVIDYPEVGFATLCFLGWGALMGPVSPPPITQKKGNKPRETELLQQLETLNQILSRSGRK
jgi:hypothetical protein